MLRAVMHGYYIDLRLYNKAKLIANPFDFKDLMKRAVSKKITEENQRKVQKPVRKLVMCMVHTNLFFHSPFNLR